MIFSQLLADLISGRDVVLATIISRNGSAPRMTGARMLIYEDGQIFGTIGGGQLEARCMIAAKEVFSTRIPQIKEFMLTGKDAASSDMICGGNQGVLVEYIPAGNSKIVDLLQHLTDLEKQRKKAWLLTRLPEISQNPGPLLHALVIIDAILSMDQDDPQINIDRSSTNAADHPLLSIHGQLIDHNQTNEPIMMAANADNFFLQPLDISGTVYILGGGHVSQQLAIITKLVGFRTVVIDDRSDFANRLRFPNVDEVIRVESFDHVLENLTLDPFGYLVIVTRGHLHDLVVLSQALKTDAVYIGMIGSKRKVETIYQALMKDEGYSREELSKVYAPIGISIDAESPEEIAVSIAAELISVRAKLQKG